MFKYIEAIAHEHFKIAMAQKMKEQKKNETKIFKSIRLIYSS